jgi:hypothetical protein
MLPFKVFKLLNRVTNSHINSTSAVVTEAIFSADMKLFIE